LWFGNRFVGKVRERNGTVHFRGSLGLHGLHGRMMLLVLMLVRCAPVTGTPAASSAMAAAATIRLACRHEMGLRVGCIARRGGAAGCRFA
jgi:hypothetical protein